jgi:hypothetical protein
VNKRQAYTNADGGDGKSLLFFFFSYFFFFLFPVVSLRQSREYGVRVKYLNYVFGSGARASQVLG